MSRIAPLMLALCLAYPAFAQTNDTPPPQVWDLRQLYSTPDAWEADRLVIGKDIDALSSIKGTLGQSPQSLLEGLDRISTVRRKLVKLYSYANLKADEDKRVAENDARLQLAHSIDSKMEQAVSFLKPEIIALGRDKVAAYESAEPKLAKHRYALERILRSGDHTLSPSEEALLAEAGEPLEQPSSIYGLLANADLPWPKMTIGGKEVTLDFSGYTRYRADADPAVRKQVFDTFWPAYKSFERTLGAIYLANLRSTVFESKARKYPSSVAMALAPNNIPDTVYRTMVAEANNGLPTLHRYYALSKKMLGLKDFRYSDMYVPLAAEPRKYTLGEAEQLTLEALKPMGEEYTKQMSVGFASAWMHAQAQPGKRSGAYMNGQVYDAHPYVLLSFTNGFESVSTLAHEWGHAMHSVMSNRTQPFETASYATFIAEIPSTTNEILLADHVIAVAKTKDEKIFALSQELDRLRGAFFRQAMFAEFELKTHEAAEQGQAITGQWLTKLYLDLLKRYSGDAEGIMKIDDLYGIEWAAIPHFYRDFYVYQYATCVSAASYFADGIGKGDLAVRQQFFDMLKAGGSDDPYLVVKRAGVDLASPAPYRALIKRMDRLMDELEALQTS